VGVEWAHTNIGLTMDAERDGDALRVRVTGLPNGRSLRNS
jgi:hypothetical protein